MQYKLMILPFGRNFLSLSLAQRPPRNLQIIAYKYVWTSSEGNFKSARPHCLAWNTTI